MPNFVKVRIYGGNHSTWVNKRWVINIEDAKHEKGDKVCVVTKTELFHVYNPYKTIEEFVNLFEPDQRDI